MQSIWEQIKPLMGEKMIQKVEINLQEIREKLDHLGTESDTVWGKILQIPPYTPSLS